MAPGEWRCSAQNRQLNAFERIIIGWPRHFFHVFNDEETVDEEGVELADQEAAMALAAAEARNLAADSVKIHSHLILRHRIEVADAEGRTIGQVRFGDAIRIEP